MSEVLKRAYASAEQSSILTVEFYHSAIGYIRLAQSNRDLTATTEGSETVVFSRAAIDIGRPSKSTTGRQEISIIIGDTSNIVYQKITSVVDANRLLSKEERIPCVFREFLPSDLSAPAGSVYRLTVTGSSSTSKGVAIMASYVPLGDKIFPSNRYFTTNFPGLKYV